MKKEAAIPEHLFTEHGKEVEEIFRRAVRQALWRHKLLGQSVTVWRDGKIVTLPPEEIQVEDEDQAK